MLTLLARNLNNLARSDALTRLQCHNLRLTSCLAAGDDIVLPGGAAGTALDNDSAGIGAWSGGGCGDHHDPTLPQLTCAGHHKLTRHRSLQVAGLHHDLTAGRPHCPGG